MLFGIDVIGIINAAVIIAGAVGTIAGFLGKKKVKAKLDEATEVAEVATAAVDVMAKVIKKTGAKEVAGEVKAARGEDPDAGEFIKERVSALGANVL